MEHHEQQEQTLSDRMRAWAQANPDKPADGQMLVDLANKMDAAWERYMREGGKDNMKAAMGAWARARINWCAVTGEELV